MNDDGRAGRVLIIEDDDLLRDLIGQFLKAQGCEVIEADSVARAREALATQQYDVVVTDVHLPDGVS
ncbi:MAG TPA: response regulator, partial [Longimicrobiales bacterium]|nr:response regulator [Longimicrobiales bacterium]